MNYQNKNIQKYERTTTCKFCSGNSSMRESATKPAPVNSLSLYLPLSQNKKKVLDILLEQTSGTTTAINLYFREQ